MCIHCGTEFRPSLSTMVYCCHDCKEAHLAEIELENIRLQRDYFIASLNSKRTPDHASANNSQ